MKTFQFLLLLLITVFSFSVTSAEVPIIKNQIKASIQKQSVAPIVADQTLQIYQYAETNHRTTFNVGTTVSTSELTEAMVNETYQPWSPEKYQKISPAWCSISLRKPPTNFKNYRLTGHRIIQSGLTDYGIDLLKTFPKAISPSVSWL